LKLAKILMSPSLSREEEEEEEEEEEGRPGSFRV
jgi:hypothetical protein